MRRARRPNPISLSVSTYLPGAPPPGVWGWGDVSSLGLAIAPPSSGKGDDDLPTASHHALRLKRFRFTMRVVP